MEEKQLDYNQPFLSVRRFTSTVSTEKNEETKTNRKLPTISSLPYYKSELKSGPVSNPGSVPFVWEKSPGRSKYENDPPAHSLEQLPVAPKLPPGRRMKVKEQALDNISESSSPTSCEGQRFASASRSYSSLDDITAKIQASRDEMEEKKSSDSEDDDEAYQDALETLSRTESFFLNCSLSGLSGLDDPELNPSGTFSTDPQTRDFMIGRFLPAAKAMACDSSHTAYKKPVVVAKEQPQQLIDVKGGNKRPNIVPNYAQVYIEEESEDEDDDYHRSGNLSTRVCGLLPKFCHLSPVQGLSVRTHAPKPAVSRRQVRSSFTTSKQETKECTGSASLEQRSIEQIQRPEVREHIQSAEHHNQKLDGSSLYMRLQGSGISTHEHRLPQSRFYKEAEAAETDSFNSEERCVNAFEELSGHQRIERDIGSATHMVEKTLYVDSVHKVASPKVNSDSLDRKELEDFMNDDVEVSKVKGFEARPLVDFRDPKTAQENGICEDYVDSETQSKVIKSERRENSSEMDSLLLIPPPLPRSPTESWLWRTLPSVPSKNSTLRSFLGDKVDSQNKAPKVTYGDLKWETIVKSSKV